MSDDNSTSLVNFGELSKPANTLIVKVSSAIGGIFLPWQIKRVAKAEAEASLLKVKTEIEITELHRRAIHRFVEEEANRQMNMEEIVRKSLPHLTDNSSPENMENDWVTNFFDKSRIVSDEEMQSIWALLLASEANAPGSFSKRTVNLLCDLDKRDAELFQTLCQFGFIVGRFTPLIFNCNDKIYNDHGIDFESLAHLESLGLISMHGAKGFKRTCARKNFRTTYHGQLLSLTFPAEKDNSFFIGQVLLTQSGQELASVVETTSVDGFYDYVKDKWASYNPSSENI